MQQRRQYLLPGSSENNFSISHTCMQWSPSSFFDPTHIHRECEIYLNLSGDVNFEVENRIYPISPGTVILTRPYEYHHCIPLSDTLHEHYWITFSAEETDPTLGLFFRRQKGVGNRIFLDSESLKALCQILDKMLVENGDHLQNRICFLQMLQILEAGRQDHVPANYPQLPATVLQALDYMDQHLAEDLRTEDIAQVCCISANTLLRHFQKSLASTPMEILRKKRLIVSRDCLIRGDSVSEAAARCGFPDYSHYIQLFRRQFGVTPLQYKKLFHNA